MNGALRARLDQAKKNTKKGKALRAKTRHIRLNKRQK
jgi:hypothetical protein